MQLVFLVPGCHLVRNEGPRRLQGVEELHLHIMMDIVVPTLL